VLLKEREFIKQVVLEDIGRGDLFSRISDNKRIKAHILAKSDGVFAGQRYLGALQEEFGVEFEFIVKDGDKFKTGDILVNIAGNSKTILSVERTIMNTTLHATSIATKTRAFVDKISKYNVKLLDTRKTRPLLRELEKYAVRCGGGLNHRMGLDDCLMLKDTHLKTINNLQEFIKDVRAKIPFTSKIEIECESLEMAKEAMAAGADIIMCDNMSLDETKEVVAFRDANYKHILLEASGNVSLDTVEAIAQTGVDAISTGSTIHQACWVDLSMKVLG